jgi:Flp pilus assembly protein TadG
MKQRGSPLTRHKRLDRALRAPSRDDKAARRGASVVEMALVVPIIFLVVFTCIEFGRLLMVVHGLEAAAREGCRTAIAWDATAQTVEDIVEERMATFGIQNYTLTLDPTSPSTACQWAPVSVRITTSYNNVSWLPAPKFLSGITFSGTCTLPQEADRCHE